MVHGSWFMAHGRCGRLEVQVQSESEEARDTADDNASYAVFDFYSIMTHQTGLTCIHGIFAINQKPIGGKPLNANLWRDPIHIFVHHN